MKSALNSIVYVTRCGGKCRLALNNECPLPGNLHYRRSWTRRQPKPLGSQLPLKEYDVDRLVMKNEDKTNLWATSANTAISALLTYMCMYVYPVHDYFFIS